MSRSTSVKFTLFLLMASLASVGLVLFDAGASAQNTNSSTTAQEDNTNANMNTGRRGRRGRRGSRRPAAQNANAGDTTGGEAATDAAAGMAQDAGAGAAQNTGGGAQEDLSGTYAGALRMTGGHEMSGQATLTVTGNTFTLTMEGMNHAGRIYAINTRRYVGAALYFDDLTDSVSNTPLACSVRARRSGNRLRLEPVPGSRNRLTFNGRSS